MVMVFGYMTRVGERALEKTIVDKNCTSTHVWKYVYTHTEAVIKAKWNVNII